MNGLQAQMVLLEATTAIAQFAANWFLQSALLITVGLATGRLLARRGSAVQSAVYRTTLAAVLICPTASSLLSLAGVSGWSLAMPRPWTYQDAQTIVVDDAAPAAHPIPASPPAVVDAALPLQLSVGIDEPDQGTPAVDSPALPHIDSVDAEIPPLVASAQPIPEPAMAPAELPTLSVNFFGWAGVGVSAVWMLISAALLARLGLSWWRMSRLRRGAAEADATTSQLCRELATRLAVAAPEVRRSPYLPSPCLAGLHRPVILLPEIDLGLSTRDVLIHELAHWVRCDCHWNLLRLLTLAAFFFQPLLWMLSRRLEMAAEEVCDDYVVQNGGDRLEYAYRLVDIAELGTVSIAAAGVGIVSLRSMLARRVERIMDPSRSVSTKVGNLLITLVLVGGLLGTLLVGLVGISPRRSSAEVAPATAEGDATKPQPATQPAAAPGREAAALLSFERDSAQLPSDGLEVWSLSFSAGDRFLAAGGRGGGIMNEEQTGQVRIWDFAKLEEIATYSTPRGVRSVALSRDGGRVAYSSWSGDIWLHEVRGVELLHETFEAPLCVALSPDGKLLVGFTERSQLRTWDAVTGKPLEKGAGGFQGGSFHFLWVGFSPDGKYLAAGGGQNNAAEGIKVAVWNVATRNLAYTLSTYPEQVRSASFTADSKTLAVCGGKSIAMFDLETGRGLSQTEVGDTKIGRVQFSSDGSLLAAANGVTAEGGLVTLWDPATGKAIGTLAGHQQEVRAMAFTDDGKTLVTGSPDRTIRLWNVADRRQIGMLPEAKAESDAEDKPAAILALAYAPDGITAATADEDGKLSIYGLSPPRLLRSWTGHADAAAALAWSPDGKTVASGGYDKTVKTWNPATGELVRSHGGHTGWVVALAFSHDGQTLASGSYDRSIRLWNMADGRERLTLAGHTATVRALAFSHDDKLLASGSSDQSVRLWGAADGHPQATLAGHGAVVRSVAFSSDDRLLASGGEDQAIKLWNVDGHDLHATLAGHTDTISSVAFAQQTLVSTSWDGTLRTWDLDALEARGKLVTGPSAVVALAVTPDGRRLLTASADRSLTLWKSSAAKGPASVSLGQYRSFPWSAAFSPDGSSLAVAAGGFSDQTDLYFYDPATKTEKYRVTFPGSVRSLAFAPKGDVLALGFPSQQLLLIDAATGRELTTLQEQPGDPPPPLRERVTEVAFSADGTLLAAASLENDIRIYNVERRELIKTLTGHTSRVLSIAFSPDQKSLISGSKDKTVIVWDLASGQRRLSLPQQPAEVLTVAWSPDGKLLATGCAYGKSVCCLWNAETGVLRKTLAAHHGSITEVRFSPDGKTLATGGADRLVKLWDVDSGDLLHTYDPDAGKVLCLRFSPDGKSLVTTGRDGGASLWSLLRPAAK